MINYVLQRMQNEKKQQQQHPEWMVEGEETDKYNGRTVHCVHANTHQRCVFCVCEFVVCNAVCVLCVVFTLLDI